MIDIPPCWHCSVLVTVVAVIGTILCSECKDDEILKCQNLSDAKFVTPRILFTKAESELYCRDRFGMSLLYIDDPMIKILNNHCKGKKKNIHKELLGLFVNWMKQWRKQFFNNF